MRKSFDVIVSGAGPAGLTCALFLAKFGKRVLVLEKEKFPRDKVCADNKTWKCLDIVKELGLLEKFQNVPKRKITGVYVETPGGYSVLNPLWKKDVEEKGTWFNVRRIFFDNFLADACKENKLITFRENCKVLKPLFTKNDVMGVEFQNQDNEIETAFCKVVVAADGIQSVIANSLGLSPQLKGRYALNARAYFKGVKNVSDNCELYYLKGVCPGYFWIFPVDDDTCNVGIGMRAEDIEKMNVSLEEKMLEVLKIEKFSSRFENAKQVSDIQKWGVSVLPGKRKWSGAGFILIGDAGTFAMTFSGEGVGPGMRSGKIASEAIISAFERNDFSEKSLAELDDKMWEILKPEVDGFKWLEFMLLHEKVFDFVLKKTSQKKELIEISSRMQNDYTLSKKLVSLKTVLKLLF